MSSQKLIKLHLLANPEQPTLKTSAILYNYKLNSNPFLNSYFFPQSVFIPSDLNSSLNKPEEIGKLNPQKKSHSTT